MARFGFERETLLDLTVNAIPLAMILFFVVAFAVVRPFGVDPVFTTIQFGILASMLVSLLILSYYAGRFIQRDEGLE